MTGSITTNYPPQQPAAPVGVTPRQTKRLGWLPEGTDQRDKPFDLSRARMLLKARSYPAKADLRPDMPPVYDQGDLGSCTANAIAGVYEYQQRKQLLEDYVPSRLFIYYEERRFINTLNSDSGAMIRDGLKVVHNLGAPHESLWPYQIGEFTHQPPQPAYDDGLKHQALAYQSVRLHGPDLKLIVASGHPVVFGFTVYQSFFDIGKDGFMPFPKPTESVEGGHAVVKCGYWYGRSQFSKAKRDWAICRNSWDPSWGAEGYFFMPMSWMTSNWNADDAWTITTTEA